MLNDLPTKREEVMKTSPFLRRRWKSRLTLTVLIVLLFLSVIIATMIGPVPISPDIVVRILLSRIPGLNAILPGSWPSDYETIILSFRFPRILMGALVGCALAVAGTTMQGLFRNPLADPYITGLSSGAAVGASLVIVLGMGVGIGFFNLPLFAFLGAFLTILLVYGIARIRGGARMETLLLVGIAVSSFFSAVTAILIYVARQHIYQVIFWLMGSLSQSNWDAFLFSFLPIILGYALIQLFSRDLNIMMLGEEPAKHLGVEVETIKVVLLILASLIAGIAVAFSGIIGFVGLIIPHTMRILVGPDNRLLLPSSALAGSSFLIWADVIARSSIYMVEIPIGIITAMCGAPFFIYLLRKKGYKYAP